jgi:hypothetical protein
VKALIHFQVEALSVSADYPRRRFDVLQSHGKGVGEVGTRAARNGI